MTHRIGALVGVLAMILATCSADDATVTTNVVSPSSPATTSTTSTTTAATTPPETPTTAPPTSSSTAVPQDFAEAQPGTFTRDVVVDGTTRQYRLFIPPGLEPGRLVGLVVDLHGFTSNPDNHEVVSQMRQLAAIEGFVVAQPAALGGIPVWDASSDGGIGSADVPFIRAMVDAVAEEAPIDRSQVFASGFSNGGGLVHRLACEASDVFAAIGTVSGAYVDWNECDPGHPVAVVSFHGTDDFVVPYFGLGSVFADIPEWAAAWAARNGCNVGPVRRDLFEDVYADAWNDCDGNADVVLFTIQDGLHSWPGSPDGGLFQSTGSISASDTFWTFFQSHSR